jgi:GAF domain-containing protein
VFAKQLHTLPGFLGTYAIIALAVALFSYSIFGLIGRLQQRIMDQNRYLSALNEIAKAAAAKHHLTDLLDISLDHILSTMKADAGLICLVDREREEHSALCSKNFSPELVRNIQRAKLQADPVAYEVVHGGRPVILGRVLEDLRVAEVARREGIQSALGAPLKAEGEVNGILVVATRQERHFSDADQELLEAIGGQLGIVIRNAVLYEQSELQNRELSALLAVGKVVTSSFDLDELLHQSLDTIIEVMPADAAEVWLMEGAEELNLRCHRGAHREAFLERTRFRVDEGIPGLLAVRQEPIVVHDLPSQAAFLRQGVIKAGFHTFLRTPSTTM